MNSRVQSVLGPVEPHELGVTLTHEHFSLQFQEFYVAPPIHLKKYFNGKITLENAGLIRQYPYSSSYNLNFNDEDTHAAIFSEMKMFNELGGGTIVENTSNGLERNVPLMLHVAQETGVHVIAGTGYYVASVQPQGVLNLTEEQMTKIIDEELREGCLENKNVKCGVIGEVGCSWPLQEFEKRSIRATANVQNNLACPVTFHPGRNPSAPFEIMRIFLEAGGIASKTVMSHLDRTILNSEELLEFASFGTLMQQDLFGTECSWYQLEPTIDMLSDAQRIDRIVEMCKNGYSHRILIAHDIHTKHRLVRFGGHGFSHILNNVVPKLKLKGIEEQTVHQILVDNPQKWLSWQLRQ